MRHYAFLALLACGGGGSATPDAAESGDNPDIPPRGFDVLTTWIAAGYYKAWACEPAPHPQEFPSNHGYNRTCNNSILHADNMGSGPLPIDAASVKELIDDDDGVTIIGMAVSRKLDDSGADGWYWYQSGGMPAKMEDGTGKPVNDCIGCHQCAPRDFTFAIVKP